MIYRIIFLIGSLNISSCLYIPVPTPESPLDNLPQKIEVGTAQRKDVTSEFGAPRVTRENGALAIYDNSKVAAYFAEFIIIGIGGAINKYESTLVEFDGDLVSFVGTIADRYGCYGNQVCLDSGWASAGDRPELAPETATISSTREDDQKAKEFVIQTDVCNLYIYTQGKYHADYPVLISIAEHDLLPISPTGYLYLQLPREKLALQVFYSGTTYIGGGEPELLAQASVTCPKSSVDYLEISYLQGEFGPNSRSAKIDLVAQEKGRNEVLQRRLLLLP